MAEEEAAAECEEERASPSSRIDTKVRVVAFSRRFRPYIEHCRGFHCEGKRRRARDAQSRSRRIGLRRKANQRRRRGESTSLEILGFF